VISDERCGKALSYLAATDMEAAELKTQLAKKEYLLDLARRRTFLEKTGNIEVRKAASEMTLEVGLAMDEYLQADA